MGVEGPGALRLDCGVRLLCGCGSAACALQHQHRRGRQALLPGAAESRGSGSGGRISVACERQQDPRRRLRPALGCGVPDPLRGVDDGEQRPFLQLQGYQPAALGPVRRDPARRPRLRPDFHRPAYRTISAVCCIRTLRVRVLVVEETSARRARPVAVARETRYISPMRFGTIALSLTLGSLLLAGLLLRLART